MSSILKAIKKRDEVNTPPVEQVAYPVIAGAPSRHPFLPLLAGAVVGGLLVVGFVVWQKGSDTEGLLVETPTAVPSPAALIAEQSTSPATPIEPVVKRVTVIEKPSALAPPVETVVVVMDEPEPINAAQPKVSTFVKKTTVSPTTASPAVAKKVSPVEQPPLVSNKSDRTVETILPEGVELNVTEIFFQEGSGSSMAIINDLPVMEGTPIDSAMVEKISADQVQFLISGKTYIVKSSLP